jgi:pentatricopeptide repeat protein
LIIKKKENYQILKIFVVMSVTLKRKLGQAAKLQITDPQTILELYETYKTHLKDPVDPVDLQCTGMMLNFVVNNLEIVYEIFNSNLQKNEGLYTTLIKALCLKHMYSKAIDYLKEMCSVGIHPHLRTFIPFFDIESEDGEDGGVNMPTERFEFLIELIQTYKLVPSLKIFEMIFHCVSDQTPTNRIDQLLQWVSDHYHCVPESIAEKIGEYFHNVSAGQNVISNHGRCTLCNHHIHRVDVSDVERESMMSSLDFNGLSKIRKELIGCQYDVIVDGTNVAMFNNSEFNWKKVDKVLSEISDQKKILVVFNIGRKKRVQNLPKRPNVTIFYSVAGEDDDLTWLYATLAMNCYCVTADKIRDHLFYKFSHNVTQNVFEKWVECHIVPYKFSKDTKNWLTMEWPARYSQRVQLISSRIHIPIETQSGFEVWYCIKKRSKNNKKTRVN